MSIRSVGLTMVCIWMEGADVGKEFHDQYVYRHANGYVTCGCSAVARLR